jgi:riboflavin kinase/FMN adenylyltransferase
VHVAYYPDESRPLPWRHPVLALGNFDGVHRGHVKITERVRRAADERAASAVAMTFDPHPSRVIRPDKAPPLLMTTQQKLEALSKAGIQGVAIVRFTSEMSRWDPETFVRAVLVEWMRATEVWVGANFLFGRDRSGNFSMLRSLGARYGFRAEKIDPVRYKDFVVSSTRVRRLIAEGRVDEAGALLGHHYYVDGSVIQGQRRGRQLGFPTANLCSDNELMPPAGVYATVAQIDGIFYPSVTNLGVRPTFEEANTGRGQVTVEAHLFDFEQDLYGRRLRLEFVQRLRDERRFESVDALKAQIGVDCAQTRALFDSMSL